ncbi:MAG: 50S ribosomal protein L24 [bacterium]|nr:50S ribosomal protein L24 [bacterium]
MKIRKGDNVLVISGKDRGRKGKVERILRVEGRVLVEGINVKTRHARGKRQGEKGQIIQVIAPLQVSNLKLVCPHCGKATRVAVKGEGKSKIRVCKMCQKAI